MSAVSTRLRFFFSYIVGFLIVLDEIELGIPKNLTSGTLLPNSESPRFPDDCEKRRTGLKVLFGQPSL